MIAERQKKRSERTEVKADQRVQELATVAFSDPLDFIDPETGEPLPLEQIPAYARRAIASIDYLPGGLVKMKFADKVAALDKLMRHLGAYNNRVEVHSGVKLADLIPKR